MQVGADISHGFNVTAQEFKVDCRLHFFYSFIKTSHFSKGIEFLEIKLWEVSFSWKRVYFLLSDFLENHIVGVVSFKGWFGDFVIAVLAGRAKGHDSRDSGVKIFLLVSEAVEFAFFVGFVALFIVDFEGDFDGFGVILFLVCFDDGAVIPATKGILAVEKVTLFEGHSPVEIFGLGLVGSDLKGMAINIDSFVIDIIQILNLNVGLIDDKDFTPAPDKFIILAIGLDNIDEIISFEGTGPLIVGELKVVMWLNDGKVT